MTTLLSVRWDIIPIMMKEDFDCKQFSCRLNGLTAGYKSANGNVIVCENLSVELTASSLTCLLGPNGGGKSTLLKTLTGVIPPISGEIEINGVYMKSLDRMEIARIVSVVLTEKGHYNAMTGLDLVAMGRTPYTGFFGRLKKIDRDKINEAIEMTGVANLLDKKLTAVSDGERQKLFIAKALAQDTPFIVLDEPTAFLDFPSKVEIFKLMKKLANQQNKTVLMSTHDLDIALPLSDNLWLLDKELGFKTGTVEMAGKQGWIDYYFGSPGIRYDNKEKHFNITA